MGRVYHLRPAKTHIFSIKSQTGGDNLQKLHIGSLSLSHRRPFNACWRLLDLPELTPRKYVQQGTQLKFW